MMKTTLIGIAGGTGGKTTIAVKSLKKLTNLVLLSLSDLMIIIKICLI